MSCLQFFAEVGLGRLRISHLANQQPHRRKGRANIVVQVTGHPFSFGFNNLEGVEKLVLVGASLPFV